MGFEDETWWSRVARPALRAWGGDTPRMADLAVPRGDPDPKALACYGPLVRSGGDAPDALRLRFADGRPVGALTTAFLEWCCAGLAATGTATLVLVWDNAAWHVSREVRRWLGEHNRRAHREGGVRIVPCRLPVKSPWLNPIEPVWVHGKRRVADPARLLTAAELEDRVYAALGADHAGHLAMPNKVS